MRREYTSLLAVFAALVSFTAVAQNYPTKPIRIAIKDGGRVYGMCLSEGERRFDVGNFDSYFRAFVEFALADPKHGPALRQTLKRLLDAPHP